MKFKSIYIWYAAPLVLLAAWFAAFYSPLTAAVKAKDKELMALKEESLKLDADFLTRVELRKRGEQAKASFEDFQAEIPVIDRLPDFMRSLAGSVKKEGLTVQSLQNLLPSVDTGEKLPLVSSVFELDVKGRFLDVGRFVEALEARKAFKEMLLARISVDEKQYPAVTAKFVGEFKAWKGKIGSEGK